LQFLLTRFNAYKIPAIGCILVVVNLLLIQVSYANDNKYYNVNISASNVAQALTMLSEQTDSAFLYPYKTAKLATARPVLGRFTLIEALELLLADSGLSGELLPNGVLRIYISSTRQTVKNSEHKPQELIVNVDESVPEIEVITIQGFVYPLGKSAAKKRYSVAQIDSLSLEDFRDLPAESVGDRLSHLSGVYIDRAYGDGQFATVRGFGPEFNTVLYNGRVIATENQGREFSFDILSPEIINSTDILKSSATDFVSGGIGSIINLQSPKPMTNKGFHGATTVKYTYDTLVENSFPELTSRFNYANDTFGVLVSFNYQQRKYKLESALTEGWYLADLSYLAPEGEDYSEVRVPRNFDLRIDNGVKKRIGGTVVVEAKITDDIKITTDVLYSKYEVESNINSSANWTDINGANQSLESVVVDNNNTLLAYHYNRDENYATDFVELNRNRPTETIQLGFNVDVGVTQDFGLLFDMSYSAAENNNGGKQKFIIAGAPNANPIYEFTPGDNYASLSYQREVEISDLRSHGTIYNGSDIKDTIFQVKADGDLLIDMPYLDNLTFGGYYSNRKKNKVGYRSPWGWEFAGYSFDVPDSLFTPVNTSSFIDGNVPGTWYSFNAEDYVGFLWSDEHIQEFIIEPNHWLADTILERKAAGGVDPVRYPSNSWQVNERLSEYYFKVNFSSQNDDFPWSGNFGARYAITEVISTGTEQEILDIEYNPGDPTNLTLTFDNATPISVRNKYQHLLPSFNFQIDITPQNIFRFGLSKTVTRPTLNELSVTLGEFNPRVGASTAFQGDPNLEPYESNNIDVSWTYYFGVNGYFNTSYFYKHFINFVSNEAVLTRLSDHDEGEFLIISPKNERGINVKGIEYSLINKFDNLPSPWNRVGTQLRYTYVKSDEKYSIENDVYLPSVEGVSDSFSAVLFYEKPELRFDIAYYYRDKYLNKSSGSLGQPEMIAAFGKLDASFSYKLNEELTVFFQASNILNERDRSYSIYEERLLSYVNSGSKYSVGLRNKF